MSKRKLRFTFRNPCSFFLSQKSYVGIRLHILRFEKKIEMYEIIEHIFHWYIDNISRISDGDNKIESEVRILSISLITKYELSRMATSEVETRELLFSSFENFKKERDNKIWSAKTAASVLSTTIFWSQN